MEKEEKFVFEVKSGGVLRATKVEEDICFDVELPKMKLTCFLKMSPDEARELGKLLQKV